MYFLTETPLQVMVWNKNTLQSAPLWAPAFPNKFKSNQSSLWTVTYLYITPNKCWQTTKHDTYNAHTRRRPPACTDFFRDIDNQIYQPDHICQTHTYALTNHQTPSRLELCCIGAIVQSQFLASLDIAYACRLCVNRFWTTLNGSQSLSISHKQAQTSLNTQLSDNTIDLTYEGPFEIWNDSVEDG